MRSRESSPSPLLFLPSPPAHDKRLLPAIEGCGPVRYSGPWPVAWPSGTLPLETALSPQVIEEIRPQRLHSACAVRCPGSPASPLPGFSLFDHRRRTRARAYRLSQVEAWSHRARLSEGMESADRVGEVSPRSHHKKRRSASRRTPRAMSHMHPTAR